ncbi:VOC family protein [Streptomyces sp. NPDC045470]|uniref:VOC family protein n=1 Tax=Streptomyces sp. NPDC045470 TaxID=3155469 RepID=UPI0033CE466E
MPDMADEAAKELPASFSHTALVVDSIEKAADRFHEVFGVSFGSAEEFVFSRADASGRTAPSTLRVTVSLTQEPYFVLVEAVDEPDCVFGRERLGSLAYWGWWEEDPEERLRELRREGVGVAATYAAAPGSAPEMIITEPDLYGTRICYVASALKNRMTEKVDLAGGEGSLPASYYHVGMVVPDIDTAVQRCATVFGVPFTAAALTESPHQEEGDVTHTPFRQRQAISRTREPYIELIEATGDGVFGPSRAGTLMYYACWESDMRSRLARLRTQGFGMDAVIRMDAASDPIAAITSYDGLGIRLELADPAAKPVMEHWARTGHLPEF